MGADIVFENGEYYRDSYNDSCLAWVKSLSYWGLAQGNPTTEEKEEFMRELSKITDEEIDAYVARKVNEFPRNEQEKIEEYAEMFRKKRDFLKNLDEKGELKIDEDGWSI